MATYYNQVILKLLDSNVDWAEGYSVNDISNDIDEHEYWRISADDCVKQIIANNNSHKARE